MKPTLKSIKVIGIIALIWNLMGVFNFIGQQFLTPEAIAAMPESQQAFYVNIPTWVTIAFGCAVFGGFLGSLLLLLKKSFSFELFLVSLFGVLVQMYHSLFLLESADGFGPGGLVMIIMIIGIALYLVLFSNKAKQANLIS